MLDAYGYQDTVIADGTKHTTGSFRFNMNDIEYECVHAFINFIPLALLGLLKDDLMAFFAVFRLGKNRPQNRTEIVGFSPPTFRIH